jgi:hypothetical protein
MMGKNYWMSLPLLTRQRLAVTLEIPRTGSTEVFGRTVITDGYTDKDLATVTLAKLQEFMVSKSDNFFELLDILIKRQETPMPIVVKKEVIQEEVKSDIEKENEDLKKEIDDLKNPNKFLYNGATKEEVIAATTPKVIIRKPGRPAKK